MDLTRDKLNCRQVADLLGMSASWVYLHTKPGQNPRLPHQRIGGTLRFFRSEIEAFASGTKYRSGCETEGVAAERLAGLPQHASTGHQGER
jgi:predicted DNA-binding transcriptional regulator AlpA